MDMFYELKKKNFGLSKNDIEDLEDIIGKWKKISNEEHSKIVNILIELTEMNVNSVDNYKKGIKILRKKYKYEPSKSKLTRVYFQDILWPKWTNSQYKIDKLYYSKFLNNQYSLMKIFLNCNTVQGSYGTVNITLVTEPLSSCKYKCAFCPHGPVNGPLKAPISYLPNEPAVARAARVNFNIIEQIRTRIRDLCLSGVIHRIIQSDGTWKTMCKADIRLAGGTFNSYPKEKREQFIREVYYAVRTIDCYENEMPEIMSLDQEIDFHTSTSDLGVLIVGLSVETRPDEINDEIIDEFNRYFLTWVELGIQSTHDDVLKKIKRGHKVKDSRLAISKLKGKMGVKILGHMMQDLPGSNPEKDIADFKDSIVVNNSTIQKNIFNITNMIFIITYIIFSGWFRIFIGILMSFISYKLLNKPFKLIHCLPHSFDHIKIYPTMKLPHTEIENWDVDQWDRYAEKDNGEILMKVLYTIVSKLPPWVRIARLIRDFEKSNEKNKGMGYESDTIRSNMAQLVDDRLKKEAPTNNEIKSREVRNNILDLNKIKFELHTYADFTEDTDPEIKKYGGTEYFGNYIAPDNENNDRLVGLFRLRLNTIGTRALFRELHVYGGYVPKGYNPDKKDKIVQHRGYGTSLMRIAEIISYLYGYKTIAVISAPGTVGYYEKKGKYHREGRYMVKDLTFKKFIYNLYNEIKSRII